LLADAHRKDALQTLRDVYHWLALCVAPRTERSLAPLRQVSAPADHALGALERTLCAAQQTSVNWRSLPNVLIRARRALLGARRAAPPLALNSAPQEREEKP